METGSTLLIDGVAHKFEELSDAAKHLVTGLTRVLRDIEDIDYQSAKARALRALLETELRKEVLKVDGQES